MTTEIKCLRLSTGEDLIAKIEYLTADKIKIVAPYQIVMAGQPSPSGDMQFAFLPWPMFAERKPMLKDGLDVVSTYVPLTYAPNQKLIDSYNQRIAAENGIVIPKSTIITPSS